MRLVRLGLGFGSWLLGALVLALAPAPASASLIGQTLDAVYYHPDLDTVYVGAVFTPSSFVVGAGQETDGNVEDVTHLLVDFADDSLTITFDTILPTPTWNNTDFNGIVFTATAPHGIASASVDGSTTMAGFDDTRVIVDRRRDPGELGRALVRGRHGRDSQLHLPPGARAGRAAAPRHRPRTRQAARALLAPSASRSPGREPRREAVLPASEAARGVLGASLRATPSRAGPVLAPIRPRHAPC